MSEIPKFNAVKAAADYLDTYLEQKTRNLFNDIKILKRVKSYMPYDLAKDIVDEANFYREFYCNSEEDKILRKVLVCDIVPNKSGGYEVASNLAEVIKIQIRNK
jgi:hypothetical protein